MRILRNWLFMLRDYSFSTRYRQFVEGKDFGAQVRVNDRQMKFALDRGS
jgi:hypothetical protein